MCACDHKMQDFFDEVDVISDLFHGQNHRHGWTTRWAGSSMAMLLAPQILLARYRDDDDDDDDDDNDDDDDRLWIMMMMMVMICRGGL